MIDFLLADENLFFSGAFILMLLIGVLQFLGLAELGPDFDTDIEGEIAADSTADGLLAFLGFGRLPLIMLMVIFLTVFSVAGLLSQQLFASVFGGLLTAWVAVPAVGILSLVGTGLLSAPLSKILPQDESTAIDIDWLVGKRATIQIGEARIDYAARAKVLDQHGHKHFVMIEPESDDESFHAGEEVLIVRREGNIFKAISPEGYKKLELNR